MRRLSADLGRPSREIKVYSTEMTVCTLIRSPEASCCLVLRESLFWAAEGLRMKQVWSWWAAARRPEQIERKRERRWVIKEPVEECVECEWVCDALFDSGGVSSPGLWADGHGSSETSLSLQSVGAIRHRRGQVPSHNHSTINYNSLLCTARSSFVPNSTFIYTERTIVSI